MTSHQRNLHWRYIMASGHLNMKKGTQHVLTFATAVNTSEGVRCNP